MPVNIRSRYYGMEIISIDGQTSFVQRLTVQTEATTDSIRHTLVGGETLDLLAARYYGREDLWWRIADANPGCFPLDWKPGDVLVIPPIRTATRMPRR